MLRDIRLFPVVGFSLLANTLVAPTRAQQTPAIAQDGRTRINFNADWRFKLGAVNNGQAADLNDAGWEQVDLPHSFSMPYFRAANLDAGDGWYRKVLTLPRLDPNRRLSLEFEGAFQDTRVYINGIEVGHHPADTQAFRLT